MFHDGNRALQKWAGSTDLADRLVEKNNRTQFSDEDKPFIESVSFFFIASASPDGQPDCSFKGGAPGFVQISSPNQLVFPDYDGNGMFKTLGNIRSHPQVGLLFIDLTASPKRLRVNGRASVELGPPKNHDLPGAQALVTVTAEQIFPNCPRYIPDLSRGEESKYIPQKGVPPVEPAWKEFEAFKDVVPPRRV